MFYYAWIVETISEIHLSRYAENLHSILQKENIEKTFFSGNVLGGYPSQHFAVMYPDMVKDLWRLDTTPLGLKYLLKIRLVVGEKDSTGKV